MSASFFEVICWATLIVGGLYAFYRLFEGRWYGAAWATSGSRVAFVLKFVPVVAIFATLILMASECPLDSRACSFAAVVALPTALTVIVALLVCLISLIAALVKGKPWRIWF